MHEAWIDEMRQKERVLRAELQTAEQQLKALAAERDAARASLRLVYRVAAQLSGSCFALAQDAQLEGGVRAVLHKLLREWDDVVAQVRREVL